MNKAFLSDMFQRLLSFNKLEQRRQLRELLSSIPKGYEAKILDFGCGTGLFATTIMQMGFKYYGYDIDDESAQYAAKLYPAGVFVSDKNSLARHGPFDIIIANCCFHHIDDAVLDNEISYIKNLLADEGRFILIDILKPDTQDAIGPKIMIKIEKGLYPRNMENYVKSIKPLMKVVSSRKRRSHVLSLEGFPVYANLLELVCVK